MTTNVDMEGDEMEMSKEELQLWIRKKVQQNQLISSDVIEKCKWLQSLLERRKQQAAHLVRLCQSVSVCEAIVKKQYSLLGWEYRDRDSDDGNVKADCGNAVTSSPLPTLRYSEDLCNGKVGSVALKRKLVVVLTRLSPHQIRSLCTPTLENHNNEDERSNNSDSDVHWEPKECDLSDSSGSLYSITNTKTRVNKRRKIDTKKNATPQTSRNAEVKSNATGPSAPEPSANTDAAPKPSTNTDAVSCTSKTPPATTNTKGVIPLTIRPVVPRVELEVNVNVLARKKALNWRPGKIVEIVKKEDGRVKYKINFKKKAGRVLVSGHHIAFNDAPKLEHLFVGARVLVKPQDNKGRCFLPGILGEVPSPKNRLRFLVFVDDHTPLYVGLPLLRLVCRQLRDPLDDLPNDFHKTFMKEYLKAWPHLPQTEYSVGQETNTKLGGVNQKCRVEAIDSSLVQLVVLENQNKQWLHRDSPCLEHNMNESKHQ